MVIQIDAHRNYTVYINLNYHLKDEMPSPNTNGWTSNNGRCYPVRYLCPALPLNITELVQRSGNILTSMADSQDDDETGKAGESDIGTDEEVDSEEDI